MNFRFFEFPHFAKPFSVICNVKIRNTKKIKPLEGSKTPISLNFPIIFEENLPFPFVHYPNHYGTFFAFSQTNDGEVFMCSCNKDLVINYIDFKKECNDIYSDDLYNAKFSSNDFAKSISYLSLNENYKISFKDKLCHRCNLTTPTLRFCHEMYGGNFKQYYGWYINQVRYRFRYPKHYLNKPDLLPEELKTLHYRVKTLQNELNININFEKDLQTRNSVEKEISQLTRKIDNYFENVARQEFGFRKIGEGNVSELILSNLVKKVYINEEIILHHRPKWLNGLEIDIFIPKLKIGFEYQGQQHFYAIKAWGGESALKKVQERDRIKKEICVLNDITLIEFDYTEPLELNYLKEKINQHCR